MHDDEEDENVDEADGEGNDEGNDSDVDDESDDEGEEDEDADDLSSSDDENAAESDSESDAGLEYLNQENIDVSSCAIRMISCLDFINFAPFCRKNKRRTTSFPARRKAIMTVILYEIILLID